MNTTQSPTYAIVVMTSVTLIAIVAAAVLIPDGYPSVIGHILTVVLPTLTALLALMRSSQNGTELTKLHGKTDELRQEASEAKATANTVNAIVAEKIAPTVDVIAKDVEVLKKNGHGDKS